jgi:hypothetical protein
MHCTAEYSCLFAGFATDFAGEFRRFVNIYLVVKFNAQVLVRVIFPKYLAVLPTF